MKIILVHILLFTSWFFFSSVIGIFILNNRLRRRRCGGGQHVVRDHFCNLFTFRYRRLLRDYQFSDLMLSGFSRKDLILLFTPQLTFHIIAALIGISRSECWLRCIFKKVGERKLLGWRNESLATCFWKLTFMFVFALSLKDDK